MSVGGEQWGADNDAVDESVARFSAGVVGRTVAMQARLLQLAGTLRRGAGST